MYATYTLTKDELNYEFLDNLKKMLTGDEIQLSVESYDETEYLMKSKRNHEHLVRAINNANNNINLIEVPFDDILKAAGEED
jgi:hypothetical protein